MIRRYLYSGFLSVIILSVLLLSSTYIHHSEKELATKIEQLSTSIINEKKLFLRNAVERTFYLIDSERERVKRENSLNKLTEEQLESRTVEVIHALLHKLRLVNDGYIWVNQILDYAGGDNYAIRLIHPNLPDSENMFLSTNMTDIQGNRPYEVELNGINKHGELYFEYYFKKMNSEMIAHKMSFAKLYKPFDWVIASGIYLDDLDLLIENETQKMQEAYNQHKLSSFAVALVAILISIVIIVLIEKRICHLIVSYEGEIKNHTDRLENLSITDSLTGLCNRFKLDNVFLYELNQAQRYNNPFSIVIADLDNFKAVNDIYGHQVGDQVIQKLAKILRDNARSADTLGRWGGEEFLIICPETGLEGAAQFAEKIRKKIELHHFPAINDITSSFGVATFHDGDDQHSMMKRADQALYRAKDKGRNRVECVQP